MVEEEEDIRMGTTLMAAAAVTTPVATPMDLEEATVTQTAAVVEEVTVADRAMSMGIAVEVMVEEAEAMAVVLAEIACPTSVLVFKSKAGI